MPLSDHEQRILHEIEKNFYEQDPDFAWRVRTETVYRHAGRNCKWAVLAFLGGLALLVTTFSSSFVLGGAGFLLMLFASVYFERNARRIGHAGWEEVRATLHHRGLHETIGDTRRRLQGRFHRGD